MDVIYGLMPAMILLGLISVIVFFIAVKNGQYDDMEGPAHRILSDDDLIQKPGKPNDKTNKKPK
jgi:cbb3-type cytochrome oxidase maturation protein